MIRLAAGCAFAALAALAQAQQGSSLSQGVAALRSGKYTEAVEALQRAAAESPADVSVHLYLATAYMRQYVPGAQTPQNLDLANRAVQEFQTVLGIQPDNIQALQSIASLYFQRAQGAPARDRVRELDEAARCYDRILAAHPEDAIAHYSLGVIAW